MKQIILLILIMVAPLFAVAQTQKHDFGSCFGKSNKKSINNKMDNFVVRVSDETGCPKEKLIYTISEYYIAFYSKSCRHLPKK